MGKKRHHSRKPEAAERRQQIRVLHKALDEKLEKQFEQEEQVSGNEAQPVVWERTLNQNGGHTGESDGHDAAIDSRSTNAAASSSTSSTSNARVWNANTDIGGRDPEGPPFGRDERKAELGGGGDAGGRHDEDHKR